MYIFIHYICLCIYIPIYTYKYMYVAYIFKCCSFTSIIISIIRLLVRIPAATYARQQILKHSIHTNTQILKHLLCDKSQTPRAVRLYSLYNTNTSCPNSTRSLFSTDCAESIHIFHHASGDTSSSTAVTNTNIPL